MLRLKNLLQVYRTCGQESSKKNLKTAIIWQNSVETTDNPVPISSVYLRSSLLKNPNILRFIDWGQYVMITFIKAKCLFQQTWTYHFRSRKMIHTKHGLIGTSFLTGQKAPISGVYIMVRHVQNTCCYTTDEERELTLKEGEPFPPHCACNRRVIWQLRQGSWVSATGGSCSFVANLSTEPALRTTTR